MKELIKIAKEKETSILKNFFQTVPYLKLDWEDLQKRLENNTTDLFTINDNIELTNNNYQASLNEHLTFKENLLNEISSAYSHNTNNIIEDFKNNLQTEKDAFFAEQKHIKNELLKIEEAHRALSVSLFEKIIAIEENYKNDVAILDDDIKEEKKIYLNKVSSIYRHKDSEEERINNKYHDLIKDYHQKNKQRLTQNSIRLSEIDDNLKKYREFHEKDTIYAKQNYFRTVTNLNDKINVLAQNYKIIENKYDEKFIAEKEKISAYLELKKEELNKLNDLTLDEFVKTYQEIDSELDSIRENFNNEETKLRNKYNREVTSINVKLHNDKEEINNTISSLKTVELTNLEERKQNQKEINELKKKISQLEKEAKKKLKLAKREYKNNLISASQNYVSIYEHTLYKRNLAEQNKNTTLNFYQELFSFDEEKTAEKTRINKEKASLKKQIVELHKQLEIVPLETQSSLAAHIYNLESNLQKLENDYNYSLAEKEKELLNLKSSLHKHNLNKTRDRINANYESELSISNITNYLQMEAEKNELVNLKRAVNLQKNEKKAICSKETLSNQHQEALSETQKRFKIAIFNAHLENKMAIKNLNEKLLDEKKNYQTQKEILTKENHYSQVVAEDFVKRLKMETVFLNDLLSDYNNLLNTLITEENETLLTFTNNSLGNTNEDEFKVFLFKTKELLLLKHQLIMNLIKEITDILSNYLEEKISLIKQERLQKTQRKKFKSFDVKLEEVFLERQSIINEISKNEEKVKIIESEINYLFEQKKYALETLIYSEKELLHLNRQKSSTRNKRLINNLNDHIKINKNLASQRKSEIKSLKDNLKSTNKIISKLNRQVKKRNYRIIKIDNDKTKSLKRINKSIDLETVVFKNLLKRLNKVSLSITKSSELYYNTLDQIVSKDYPIKKTVKSLNVALARKQKILSNFLLKTLETVDLKSQAILKKHALVRNKQINYQNRSLSLLAKNHLKNISKLNKAIKNTNKSAKSKETSIKKLQKSVVDKLLKEQIYEIKEKEEIIKNLNEKRLNNTQKYQDMKKAFEINRDELLLNEKNALKENLKNSLKSNQRLIKETKANINTLEKEIEYDEKKHTAQLNYFFQNDKQSRKKLHHKQNNNLNSLNKEIVHLKKRLPKLDQDIIKIIDKRKTAEERLKKKLNIIAYFNNIKNKIKLKFSIFKEKQIIKKDVIKQLYSKK